MQIKLLDELPNELLYGRAGYLWACLFINKHIGEGTIPSTSTVSLSYCFIGLRLCYYYKMLNITKYPECHSKGYNQKRETIFQQP